MDQHRLQELDQEVVDAYERYAPELLRYGRLLARNEDSALDAVQETFLRYCAERRRGRDIANSRAWLYQVLRNYLFNSLRAEDANQTPVDFLEHLPAQYEDAESRLCRSAAAQALISSLTQREWDCVRLRTEGWGYSEIAQGLGIRPGTVGALLSRAHGKLDRLAGASRATWPAAEAPKPPY